ncbi:MAG: hypothetical protein WCB68_17690 [Pyrinomonadaceae bacterium]
MSFDENLLKLNEIDATSGGFTQRRKKINTKDRKGIECFFALSGFSVLCAFA